MPSGRRRLTHLRGYESVNVAGESHYQEALRAICANEPPGPVRKPAQALLVPEPDNPHDADAVRVEIDGHKVGYLPRTLAGAYGPMLARITARGRTAAAEATVAGRPGDDGLLNLGVFLRMPPPGEEPAEPSTDLRRRF